MSIYERSRRDYRIAALALAVVVLMLYTRAPMPHGVRTFLLYFCWVAWAVVLFGLACCEYAIKVFKL